MIEHVLTELQHAETGSGPWKLYIYGRSGYHTGGKWFRAGKMQYPDEEISGTEAYARCQKAIRERCEVRICDGGDMLVFHSANGTTQFGEDFWNRTGIEH